MWCHVIPQFLSRSSTTCKRSESGKSIQYVCIFLSKVISKSESAEYYKNETATKDSLKYLLLLLCCSTLFVVHILLHLNCKRGSQSGCRVVFVVGSEIVDGRTTVSNLLSYYVMSPSRETSSCWVGESSCWVGISRHRAKKKSVPKTLPLCREKSRLGREKPRMEFY